MRLSAKMDGFYVGIQSGIPHQPGGIFDKALADTYVDEAKSVGIFFETVEKSIACRTVEILAVMDERTGEEPQEGSENRD